jgi:uncharacterized protein (TIGR02646 family)
MQYIKKQNTPPFDWEVWFTKATGERTYDYADYSALTQLKYAKEFLLNEQHNLCAYCQKTISLERASIEHVIPKKCNKELSTNYYNLVAVCKVQTKDTETGKLHCDKHKEDHPITPFIFFSDADVTNSKNNPYFDVGSNGEIRARRNLSFERSQQVEAFISVLNLNHKALKESRTKDVLDGILQVFRQLKPYQQKSFWESQFNRIVNDKKQPYRQYLLIYIGNKRGIH